MGKDALQRKSVEGGHGKGRTSSVEQVQLNVRISTDLMRKLQKLSKNSGRSIAWIVDHAIRQTLEFNG